MVSEKNSPSKVEAEVSVSVDSLDRESESEESDEQFNSEHSRSVNMPRVKLCPEEEESAPRYTDRLVDELT